jgi:hypothetical protein
MFKRALVRSAAAPRVVVVQQPRQIRRRVGAAFRRAAPHARRVGRHARAALPVAGVAVGAVVMGYAQSKGLLDKLPQIGGSKVLTLALIGYAATRFSKNPAIRQAGLAALAAAAFDFGRVQGGSTSGFEDDGAGDAGGGAWSGQG